jgi:hypothetical protein
LLRINIVIGAELGCVEIRWKTIGIYIYIRMQAGLWAVICNRMQHFGAVASGLNIGCILAGTVAQPKRLDLEPAPSYLAPYQYGCADAAAGMVYGAAQP